MKAANLDLTDILIYFSEKKTPENNNQYFILAYNVLKSAEILDFYIYLCIFLLLSYITYDIK